MRPAPRIDRQMIDRIKELRGQKKTQDEIASEVGITQGTVSLILRAHGLGGYLPETLKRRKWSDAL